MVWILAASRPFAGLLYLIILPSFLQEKEILSDHCKNLTTEYDPHFGQEVFAEESGVHIPIEIYEGCEYMFVFCCLSHFCKFGRKFCH